MMGQRNPDRERREARAHYLGALGRARAAGRADKLEQIPLHPDADWSEQHWQTLLDITAALRALVDARRDWDGLRREQPPH